MAGPVDRLIPDDGERRSMMASSRARIDARTPDKLTDMALPEFEVLMRPLLVTIEDGCEWKSSDIQSALARQFSLTDTDLAETLRGGGNRFVNLVAWALHHLSRAKLVERRRPSVYRITDRGRTVLAEHPTSIDVEVCMRFDEWHHSKTRRRAERQRPSPAQPEAGHGATRRSVDTEASYPDREQPAGARLPQDPRADFDIVAQLERLTGLHSAGALTDEEFTIAKSRILGSPN
jgi:hypothetical protein